ncbi:MAG: hypothetical protein LBC87_11180 [Fibromonadaceae bacterium]|jgi:uncharacterized protein (TIGR02145 family)|nr:hypothetical protein [Fibromonadaceae bacterium]
MKANALSLLLMLLLSACYVDVYETGKSSSSYYTYSSDSHSGSSSSQKIEPQDSVHCGERLYKVVKMGSQIWTAQNLNEIPKSGNSWCYGTINAHCTTHGRLYDWEAARNVCSTCEGSWKLPSRDDYDILRDWDADDLRATSVWHAVYGGLRFEDESRGPFALFDIEGYWWSSTKSSDWVYYFTLERGGIGLNKNSGGNVARGFSVRCIKN